MQLIRVASGKKKVLKFIKRLGYVDMYETINNLPNGSECDLFFDTEDERFKAIVDQSKLKYEDLDECLKTQFH